MALELMGLPFLFLVSLEIREAKHGISPCLVVLKPGIRKEGGREKVKSKKMSSSPVLIREVYLTYRSSVSRIFKYTQF
ncbi:hypothetical protein HD806DRAFT_486123 [Xylariaceae sp. AK1471]|nr:hypothetical protein HD806DRAFT_486123 [Xylariaceae sp. AK1471]